MSSSTSTVKSADRTLLLFELFARKQKPLTVTQISQAMDLPQSSTSMLVQSLLRLGYLEQDTEERTYYPTLRIAFLGTWLRRRHEHSGKLPLLASEVAEETGESVILSMRNGIHAQYLLAQSGQDPLRLHVESGMLRPLACCACGWALLSLDSDNEIGKIVRRTKAEFSHPTWLKTADEAPAKVAQFRKQRYIMSDGQTTPGASSIAVLLPPSVGRVPIAVAVGGPTERIVDKKRSILSSLSEMSRNVTTASVRSLITTRSGEQMPD